MRHAVLLLAAIAFAGCKVGSPPAGGQLQSERCKNIADLSDVMHCELAPFTSGTAGDEVAFRKALEQLRDVAPSDPVFFNAEKPWPTIVQTMLETRNYKQGCADCHRAFQRVYKERFMDTQIPWTDVHPK